ncbi:hypothetical protein ATANTOWER_017496 [Ataeniobius toweri]|uniref:Uncharacterized protein n=1 Tax=Ataeniobius toweri TaxID=208326 RepID=A0ABU7A892_9TELE|nr:hypothetical protein [Ataeniobius toweri]
MLPKLKKQSVVDMSSSKMLTLSCFHTAPQGQLKARISVPSINLGVHSNSTKSNMPKQTNPLKCYIWPWNTDDALE